MALTTTMNMTMMTMTTKATSTLASWLLVLLACTCTTTTTTDGNFRAVVHAQPQNTAGWSDEYKLDYSYNQDPTFNSNNNNNNNNNGPDNWSTTVRDGEIGDWARYYSDDDDDGGGGGGGVNVLIGRQPTNQCDSSQRQSPVLLNTPLQNTVCQDLHEPLTRQMDSDVDCTRNDVTFAVTPYSLRAYMPLNDGACLRPSLTLSGRIDPYVLLFMEWHARSEHVVNGQRYDAELQMVHAGTGREVGQLLTVSLLMDASAEHDNYEVEWLLRQWTEVVEQETAACETDDDGRRERRRLQKTRQVEDYVGRNVDASSPGDADGNHGFSTRHIQGGRGRGRGRDHRTLQFTPSPCQTDRFGNGCEPLGPRRRMFPYNLWEGIWYYGYSGSLAAPPCTEVVQWRVLDQPLRISRRQYKVLAQLLTQSRDENCQLDTATSAQGENWRPIQQENPFFYHCTNDNFGYFVYEPDLQ